MPAMCVMPAGNIALGGSVAGMASSYRRPASTLGQLVQEASSYKDLRRKIVFLRQVKHL